MNDTFRDERPSIADPFLRPRVQRVELPRAKHAPRVAPTARALWLGLLASSLLATAIVAGSVPLLVLGGLLLAFLPAAWFASAYAEKMLADTIVTVPLEASTPSRGHARPLTLAPHRPHTLCAYLAPPSSVRISAITLTPRGSDTLRLEVIDKRNTEESPNKNKNIDNDTDKTSRASRAETHEAGWMQGPESPPLQTTFTVTSQRLGDAFLHGFIVRAEVGLGLFSVSAWVKSELVFRTLPERLLSRPPELTATRAVESQSDLVQRDRRGFGMEIRELRDFAPGDPFKHIAWRASARRGKLVSREFESDRSLSVWLCLDVSPSMWWGAPGKARIDHALTLACELARSLASGRDKVGLIIHDHTDRLVIEPGRGPLQVARMTEALLEVPHLYLEDLTEVTQRELIEQVARWFEVQEHKVFPRLSPQKRRGADGRPLPRQSPIDIAALAAACREHLGASHRKPAKDRAKTGERHDKKRPLPISAYAVDPDLATLRIFCREVGIALPPDPTPRPGGQAQGIEAALSAVLAPHTGKKSSAHTIVAMTDLTTADDHDALRRVALTARRHRHSLIFVLPIGERAELLPPKKTRRGAPPHDRLMRALLDIQDLRAEETRRTVQALLRPAGASFITVNPGDSPARILGRLEAI